MYQILINKFKKEPNLKIDIKFRKYNIIINNNKIVISHYPKK